MDNLFIEKTNRTPKISLNKETGQLSFKGRSLPEDSAAFYKPVFEWLNQYTQNLPTKTDVLFELDYFNTSSAKAIFSIFVKLDELFQTSHPISIRWNYDEEDEGMKDLGEEYQDLFKIPIQLVKIEE